jgi:outer membrane protein
MVCYYNNREGYKKSLMKLFNKLICLTTALFICFSAVLSAEEALSSLTLQQCVELARKKSENLAIQSEHMAQAGQRVKEYRGNILPSVGYNYVKTYLDTAGGKYTSDLNDSYFSLAQPLFYGLRDFEAYKQAKNQTKTEGYIYESVERDLRSQVATAFYSLALVNADIINIKNNEKLLEDRVSELTDRVRLGKSRDSEILMVRSQIAGLKAQEEGDLGARANAVEVLAFLTGLEPSSISVNDDTPAVNAVEPLESFISSGKNRPEIKAASSDVVSQGYSLNMAKGANLPTLNLLAYWYTHRDSSYPGSDWNTFLTLNFPLFQGGSVQARVAEESSRLKEYENKLSLVTRETESEIRRLYQQAVSSVKQSAAYQDAYDKTVKSYEMQVNDYRYGLVNNLDVLESMSTMLDTKRSLDRALIQAKVDKILLDIAASK